MPIKSHFRLLIDALKLSRVNNLFIIGCTQYAGAVFVLGRNQNPFDLLMDARLLGLVVATMIVAASGYFINDYYDIKIDLINKPNKVIVGKNIKRRPVMLAHLGMNTTGILLGVWVSVWVGLVNLVCAVLLWWYSNQLKRLPFVGNFVVALMTAATLLVLGVFYQRFDLLLFVYAFFAFGITLIREVIKDIEDMEGDERFGGATLPIVIGMRKTKYVLYVLMVAFFFALCYFLYRLASLEMTIYFSIMGLFYVHFIGLLVRADTKIAFTRLSNYCKWLIVAGIFSMAILYI
ncbi:MULTISPECIES: geranylgeranylglycerol-phosphate geranylgeranyltransferase [Reichenbachiella]|uniref:geranylgeranylglycerol-phosphate geranylgeranyltransferase n=1 Tax=Reichenbachiella TaxID=156993 RepID=UPI000E6C3DF9|nr:MULTISPECIES: geranylgeranylglycerol-phosphate geranylgeranyltransferase [Reichenbachiella]MBU2915579.1 geranylgeranylglycerol-phosphate geranylgeranyltransferase [Reichenbachiella agariperforans]RJE71359.1 hypothetical protein BGP76_04470 [Reichenbachiella sp. MSK19-1]